MSTYRIRLSKMLISLLWLHSYKKEHGFQDFPFIDNSLIRAPVSDIFSGGNVLQKETTSFTPSSTPVHFPNRDICSFTTSAEEQRGKVRHPALYEGGGG